MKESFYATLSLPKGWGVTYSSRAKKMSETPGVLSCHAVMMVPAPEIPTEGYADAPVFFERLEGEEKVPPPSIDFAMKMS